MKAIVSFFITISLAATCAAQQDSAVNKKFSIHWQATAIPQYHFGFKSPYSGLNSLQASEPLKTSFTTTLYLAYKPFRSTYLVFDPEAAGGKGLSKTLGVAGFPNGEIYRVGDPAPKPYIARLYVEQRFPLSDKKEAVEGGLNAIQETTNKEYISVLAGKFSLTDFFDNGAISHDPRTQYLNWGLMGSGAWDYPANVRGYTLGLVIQALYHDFALRYAITSMPTEANGASLQWKYNKAMGQVLELEKEHLWQKDDTHFGTLHAGVFWNKARMGNYETSIKNSLPSYAPDITDSRVYGRDKFGFYGSIDNHFGKFHHFIKASWNDGKNETWAFTEIDRSFATGVSLDGSLWKRNNDHFGMAILANRLSKPHRDYIAAGGYGFLIGDGKLNYAPEEIAECYYSFNFFKWLYISPDYQFILHPAYNKDRGPVNVAGLRVHVEI
ncbi:carbohydrate porin [Foetidibacter luteolus]|uniref:carbohydrate porin n=1 Tax=Foetidibacter luteolus TaxID=2608880 RepID=UPI00129A633A|nr:carbohydrate porin [Foetidibacter luteolus]